MTSQPQDATLTIFFSNIVECTSGHRVVREGATW